MKNQVMKMVLFGLMIYAGHGNIKSQEYSFEVSGWVQQDQKGVRKAKVEIYEESQLLGVTQTNRWGNFKIGLQPDKEYVLIISGENTVNKRVAINTTARNRADVTGEVFLEFVVDLHDQHNGIESGFINHLVVFDSDVNDFVYLQPLISEYLPKDDSPVFNEVIPTSSRKCNTRL